MNNKNTPQRPHGDLRLATCTVTVTVKQRQRQHQRHLFQIPKPKAPRSLLFFVFVFTISICRKQCPPAPSKTSNAPWSSSWSVALIACQSPQSRVHTANTFTVHSNTATQSTSDRVHKRNAVAVECPARKFLAFDYHVGGGTGTAGGAAGALVSPVSPEFSPGVSAPCSEASAFSLWAAIRFCSSGR